MQYNYSTEMFTRRAKPIRIIGNPDDRRPDTWSSAVCLTKSDVRVLRGWIDWIV